MDAPRPETTKTVGLLLSGGLDSAILLKVLLDRGNRVQPFYIDFGQYWQADELRGVESFLAAISTPNVLPLVTLDLPLADIYEDHWSITGQNIPSRSASDDRVYLPGHNPLLIIKPALWCQHHGIHELALATLGTSPFADAKTRFFEQFESALDIALSDELRLLRPFSGLDKQQVMELGRDLPLELTFSCLAPVDGLHCGACNKCAERQEAFRLVCRQDRTQYAKRRRGTSRFWAAVPE